MTAKVCGLTREADLRSALDAGADLVGFLSHPPSPRHCPDLALARLAGERAVLVAVASDLPALLNLAERAGTPWIQPYVPPGWRAEALERLRGRGLRILLPWPDEPDQAPHPADLYLWETSPARTGLLGGSGHAHPMAHPPPGPFLLAGGLGGGELAPRIRAMPPQARGLLRGFDAASRLEASLGLKDPLLVNRFVGAAHALELP